jgi:hypothetical protein
MDVDGVHNGFSQNKNNNSKDDIVMGIEDIQ